MGVDPYNILDIIPINAPIVVPGSYIHNTLYNPHTYPYSGTASFIHSNPHYIIPIHAPVMVPIFIPHSLLSTIKIFAG